ncbi:MAG: heterodisulfide reductase-related iron-sulfur binding cluster [Anaerolineae bacterium]
MPITISSDLAQFVLRETGQNVYLCYQCKRCTAGCPVAQFFDLTPNQIMRAVQLGQRDVVLHSRTISLCAACITCSTRCPQGLDVARIMDVLEIEAQKEKIKSPVRSVPLFYKAALRGIRWFGRMYELGLMAELYLRLFLRRELSFRQLFKYDAPMAIKMFRSGKLKLLPSIARKPKREAAPPTPEPDAISYYPGCSLHSTGIEYQISTVAVADTLGLKLKEPEGWVCCGTSPAHSTDHYLSTVLPLKTLAEVERSGLSYVTVPCASCFSRFRIALHDVRTDPELAEKVAREIEYLPSGGLQVDSLLTTMTDRVGFPRIAAAVKRPLKGLKVVCYYGCLLTRPPDITGAPEPEYPTNMDELMRVLGAEPLDWSYKTDCCGGSLSISVLPVALNLTQKILRNAREVGADAVIVACPLCHVNLDTRQAQIAAEFGGEYDIPILYFTQAMGLAFGLPSDKLGLEKHLVSPLPLLKGKGLI